MRIPNVNENIKKTEPPHTSEDNPDDYNDLDRGPEEFEWEHDEH